MKIKLKISNEKIIALILGLISSYVYISELSSVFSPLKDIRIIFYPLIYLLGIVAFCKSVKQKSNNGFFAIIIIFFMFIIFSIHPGTFYYFLSKHKNISIFISDMFYFLFISLPLVCILRCNKNNSILIEELKKISGYIIILFILTFVIKVLLFRETIDYMNISYGVLPWIFFSTKSKNRFVFALRIISIIAIAVIGCRGALLTTIIFYFFNYVCKRITFKQILKLVVITLVAFFMVLNLNNIARFSYNGLRELGFRSRTLELYLDISVENGLFHYSDREELQTPLIEKIDFFGHGLYGDRLLTSNNAYSHNLFLELLIDFGYIFGGVLSLIVIAILIKSFLSLFKSDDISERLLLSISLAFICCKYMVSSSYLHSPEFWFYFMILIDYIFIQKEQT